MKRKQHSGQFKARLALEALQGQKTLNQLAAEYGVHPTQISHWNRQLQDGVQGIFSSKRRKDYNQARPHNSQGYLPPETFLHHHELSLSLV